MGSLFATITAVCGKIQVISDLVWDFPTNLDWYASIPILGNFSLAIILLVGSGIFFTFRLRFIQVRKFGYGVRLLVNSRTAATGISPLAAFLLSTAMRVGPGNIIGVTGAISTGGPGALFWMWISAFFGMATAFVESTLSQIFKEKNKDEYIGGMPFYGARLLRGAAWVGSILSLLYLIYAFLCLPAQGFNTVSAVGSIASIVSGSTVASDSAIYWIAFVVILICTAVIAFGGIKKVTKVTDLLVPVMAVVYLLTVIVLVICNYDRIPWFFQAVFTEAFKPEAVFGGAFGVALAQGIRRGLMSNEAGQGTITMAAAASDAKHPCDQGIIQSLGVFLDTIVICTLTGFVLVMGQMWLTADSAAWFELGKLDRFLASCSALTGSSSGVSNLVTILITVCFGLFAYTCLLGFMSFGEICAERISKKTGWIAVVRVIFLLVISFGVITEISGLDLSALWNLSDFANIIMVYCNLPLLYLGFRYVLRAYRHFEKGDGSPFTSEVAGIEVAAWDEKAAK